ncbi:hypothetical protein ACFSCZ_19030 [Siminovitchia sediminis]|uniref:Uncharacterized protein n=1 Tax=Siminovitchia sediminis TaxID=1274353 RepID=A0ABW4KLK0_9BACI
MNNLFEERRTLFLLLLGIVFSVLLTGYVWLIQPLSSELKGKKNSHVSLEEEIAVLKAQQQAHQQTANADALLLQKKVPLQPELEKLLLSFQELEYTNGSRINQVEFLYDGTEPEFDFAEGENGSDSSSSHNQAQDPESSEERNTGTSETTPGQNKPDNLHTVTAKLSVLSPDYEHFIRFVQDVESLERITRVDQLEFFLPAEKDLAFQADSNESVAFTLQVTTFYYDQ